MRSISYYTFFIFFIFTSITNSAFSQLAPRDSVYYESSGVLSNPQFVERLEGWEVTGCGTTMTYANPPFAERALVVACVGGELLIKQCSDKFLALDNDSFIRAESSIRALSGNAPLYWRITSDANVIDEFPITVSEKYQQFSSKPFRNTDQELCVEISSAPNFTGVVNLTQLNLKEDKVAQSDSSNIGVSSMNLIGNASFEGRINDDQVNCVNATAETENDVVLKTANNKRSLKITATDDNAFCIVDKEVDEQWDASIDVVKFAWFKTSASGASFVSRIDGNDEDLQKSIYPTDRWHSLKLRTTSGEISNGYKINLATNGDVVYLDEQEIRPLNSSDQLTRDDVQIQQVMLTGGVLNQASNLDALTKPLKMGDGIFSLSSEGVTALKDAEFYISATTETSGGNDNYMYIYFNGTYVHVDRPRNNYNNSSTPQWANASFSSWLKAGDKITFLASGTSGVASRISIFAKESKPINVVEDKEDYPLIEAAGNNGESITANVTDIPFIATNDKSNLWDGSKFTASKSGYYAISGGVLLDMSTVGAIYAYVNGVQTKSLFSGEGLLKVMSGVVKLNKDDVLSFRHSVDTALINIPESHHLHIQYFPNVETLLAKLKASNIKGGIDYGVDTNLIAGYASFGGATDGSACTSSPCTRYREVGELAENMSAVKKGTGYYSVTVSGLKPFSSVSCIGLSSSVGGAVYLGTPSITDSLGVSEIDIRPRTLSSNPIEVDSFFQIECKGPRPE